MTDEKKKKCLYICVAVTALVIFIFWLSLSPKEFGNVGAADSQSGAAIVNEIKDFWKGIMTAVGQ
jgi:hypothetical protein